MRSRITILTIFVLLVGFLSIGAVYKYDRIYMRIDGSNSTAGTFIAEEDMDTISELETVVTDVTNIIDSAEINSIAKIEALAGSVDIITDSEINTEAKLETIIGETIVSDDEVDTEAKLETLIGENVIIDTELDSKSELEAAVGTDVFFEDEMLYSTMGGLTASENLTAKSLVEINSAGNYVLGNHDGTTVVYAVDSAVTNGNSFSGKRGYVTVVADTDIDGGSLVKSSYDGNAVQALTTSDVSFTMTSSAGTTFSNQPANDSIDVVSDAGADTGTVTLIGTTNGTDTVVTEDVTLNGTTVATSSKSDWGELLAVKLSASQSGTITISENSGSLTITTITTGNTSKGVVSVDADQDCAFGRSPFVDADGASTAQVGFMGVRASDGTDVYVGDTLSGTTDQDSGVEMLEVTEFYVGSVDASVTASLKTNDTADNQEVIIGRALKAVSSGNDALIDLY